MFLLTSGMKIALISYKFDSYKMAVLLCKSTELMAGFH